MKKPLMMTLAAYILIVSMAVTGCGVKRAEETSAEENYPPGRIEYPIETNVQLRFWHGLDANVSKVAATMNELPFCKELSERTGIKVEYIHPPQGQGEEKFNLMLSSGDLPDIIHYNWAAFPGGPDKAIEDGYIISLSGIIRDYAPNMYEALTKDPKIDKLAKTNMGHYYVFPMIKPDKILGVSWGPMIRKDWLDDLGLPVPETVDDWYMTLKAFKERKGAVSPLLCSLDTFKQSVLTGAYGIKLGFFADNGKVRYGPAEPAYKDFIRLINKWYQEGLADIVLAGSDDRLTTAKILNGDAGVFCGYAGGGMGVYLEAKQGEDPKFDLTAVPYPVMNRGELPRFGRMTDVLETTQSVAISAKSKYPKLAARFLDYAYSEEGHMLHNFGTEGLSYTMVDGEPVFTDLILKNPEGLSVSLALSKYTRRFADGPYISDVRAYFQSYPFEQQKRAIEIWMNTDAANTNLPQMSLTSEESAEFAAIMVEVGTFVEEMTARIIMGEEPLENLDKFEQQLKSMNVDRAIEIQQKAFDRFNGI